MNPQPEIFGIYTIKHQTRRTLLKVGIGCLMMVAFAVGSNFIPGKPLLWYQRVVGILGAAAFLGWSFACFFMALRHRHYGIEMSEFGIRQLDGPWMHWRAVAGLEMNALEQRLLVVNQDRTRRIRIEYQLENFEWVASQLALAVRGSEGGSTASSRELFNNGVAGNVLIVAGVALFVVGVGLWRAFAAHRPYGLVMTVLGPWKVWQAYRNIILKVAVESGSVQIVRRNGTQSIYLGPLASLALTCEAARDGRLKLGVRTTRADGKSQIVWPAGVNAIALYYAILGSAEQEDPSFAAS